jgi:uncharacterized membrane protein YgcG
VKRWPVILLACLWAFWLQWPAEGASAASQTERILSFDSETVIHPEGDIVVTETIQVQSLGDKIQRGIYRDFPTQYKDRKGLSKTVGFTVLKVLRDQKPEAYHTEKLGNGMRVYIGQKSVLLPPGVYTYTLTYRTDRQIGFFKDYDELYWNVTGNDWAFPIDKVRAKIELPPGATVIQNAAYTGYAGDNGKDYTVQLETGSIRFSATRSLAPGEGLTVAVAWPKGYVVEPDLSTRVGTFWAENWAFLLAVAGLFALLVYYAVAWWKVGRDPEKGTIIPRYVPPEGISPAAVRFVMNMGFDKKALAVAVVSMAVKGYLTISEDKDGEYQLHATGKAGVGLSTGEAKVSAALFPKGSDTIKLKQASHGKVSEALKSLRTRLAGECEKVYFLNNIGSFLPGLGISLISLLGLVISTPEIVGALFMIAWLSIWSIGVYALAIQVVTAWRSRHVAGATAVTLFALPFFIGELVGIGFLWILLELSGALVFGGLLILNTVFYHLLKAPTLVGRRLMDEIEGLKLYMTVAEQDRLNLLHPPERTPEHFEHLLPYAMALDIENEWNDQFADVLSRAAMDPASEGPHALGWYNGRTSFMDLGSHMGRSLSGAIASSSQAPGSSSGSGGGGSSGGGGGGGGGGGW